MDDRCYNEIKCIINQYNEKIQKCIEKVKKKQQIKHEKKLLNLWKLTRPWATKLDIFLFRYYFPNGWVFFDCNTFGNESNYEASAYLYCQRENNAMELLTDRISHHRKKLGEVRLKKINIIKDIYWRLKFIFPKDIVQLIIKFVLS
jgi:hypothetical protein